MRTIKDGVYAVRDDEFVSIDHIISRRFKPDHIIIVDDGKLIKIDTIIKDCKFSSISKHNKANGELINERIAKIIFKYADQLKNFVSIAYFTPLWLRGKVIYIAGREYSPRMSDIAIAIYASYKPYTFGRYGIEIEGTVYEVAPNDEEVVDSDGDVVDSERSSGSNKNNISMQDFVDTIRETLALIKLLQKKISTLEDRVDEIQQDLAEDTDVAKEDLKPTGDYCHKVGKMSKKSTKAINTISTELFGNTFDLLVATSSCTEAGIPQARSKAFLVHSSINVHLTKAGEDTIISFEKK